MKILFLTLYPFKTLNSGYIAADLANELVKQKHELTVISPCLDVNEKKSLLKKTSEYTHYYVASGPIQKVNPIKKVLGLFKLDRISINYIRKREKKFDLVITMVSHCAFYKTVKQIKQKNKNIVVYNLVKDIFPQNVADLGMMKVDSFLYKYFQRKEDKYYAISNYLGVISPACVSYMKTHHEDIAQDKIEYNPNSIITRKVELTKEQINEIKLKYRIPLDKTLVIYGGNLGKPQGIEFLLDCIKSNENREDSFFIIIGAGTEYTRIDQFLMKEKIKNSSLNKFVSQEDFRLLVAASDIGLVFLNRSFTIPNYPSRVLSYMEASLPILFAVDSTCDAATIAENEGYGLSCLNGELDKFNRNLSYLLADTNRCKSMGQKAYLFLCREYNVQKSVEIIMAHFR